MLDVPYQVDHVAADAAAAAMPDPLSPVGREPVGAAADRAAAGIVRSLPFEGDAVARRDQGGDRDGTRRFYILAGEVLLLLRLPPVAVEVESERHAASP